MADEIKKGDIVYLDGWCGVIGQVVEYNPKRRELTLKWPHTDVRLNRYGGTEGLQYFNPVERAQIEILTAQALFVRMSAIISQAWKHRQAAITEAINNYSSFQVF